MTRSRGRPRESGEPRSPLAARIDQSLARTGLTNEEIARKLEPPSTAGTISHWRIGRHHPDWPMIQQIAVIAGVSDYWLLTGRDDPRREVAAFLEAQRYWNDAIARGEDPRTAWERIIGRRISEADQETLQGVTGMTPFTISLDGERWIELTGEQHRVVTDLIRLLAPDYHPEGDR